MKVCYIDIGVYGREIGDDSLIAYDILLVFTDCLQQV